MFYDFKTRLILILILIGSAIYILLPSYYKYFDDKNISKTYSERALKLGLDLQGGMYVLLEIDLPILIEKLADKLTGELKEAIILSNNKSIEMNIDFFDSFLDITEKNKIRLSKNYITLRSMIKAETANNKSIIELLKNNRDNAIQSAIEILRNRVDEFGVSEPTIQRFGNNRIIVELAGIQDSERARSLIQRTASLELSLVLDDRYENVISAIDNYFLSNKMSIQNKKIVNEKIETLSDTNSEDILLNSNKDIDELVFNFDDFPEPEGIEQYPFSSYITQVREGNGVLLPYISKFNTLLNEIGTSPSLPRGGRFVWGNSMQSYPIGDGAFIEYKPIYYISDNPAIKGGMIKNPSAQIAPPGSQNAGQWVISLEMNQQGARFWNTFTGANIGNRVAIVLDNKVYMAPFINDQIPTGQTLISGLDNANEAQDIANVLRAGELPAPINIIEERTVGPSLGADSIESGKNALIFAFISILIFILFYYKISGIFANIALLLNVIFILSLLSLLGATLTLPGIAGLILTIGISVDANVIIFERIKEELTLGKDIFSAIKFGYKRAFVTIFDANITTLIAAFVLANIGSGPIKGFAITLSIGIICSMFTAIFVTRTLFIILLKTNLKKLSI